MSTMRPPVRFAAIGLNHFHIYRQTDLLLNAGGQLVSFYAPEPELLAAFASKYPQARPARSASEILEDDGIQLVISAGIPHDHGPLGIQVMQHGKDYMSDKPGFTSLAQLDDARRVQATTGRIYSVFYAERMQNPATVKAGELVRAGAVGQVVQAICISPHRLSLSGRPGWFFRRDQYGGILVDNGSHQIDQFLFLTGSTEARIVAAHVGNFKYPQYPELEEFGDVLLCGNGGMGYARVDWYTPDGLPTWGDRRIFILGTDGYIEVRKNNDLAGRAGENHLFLVDQAGVHYFDCAGVELPYPRQLLDDIVNRTETAMSQAHCFLAAELSLHAQASATKLGYLQ